MTKPMQTTLSLTIAALGLLTTTGCISSRETVHTDVARTPVTFASEKAGRTFYETLAFSADRHAKTEKHVGVNLILINVQQTTVAGPNKVFNQAVAVCDTDHDGTITETEASLFASAWPTRKG
jgi:hypothetical protein